MVKAIITQYMLRLILVPSPVSFTLTYGDSEKVESIFAKCAIVIFKCCNIDCCTSRTFPGVKWITDLASIFEPFSLLYKNVEGLNVSLLVHGMLD